MARTEAWMVSLRGRDRPATRLSGRIGRAAEEGQQHRHAAAAWVLDNGGERCAAV
jgi:hypothetical protein